MTTFFTSDQHFGHINILDYCPGRKQYLKDPDSLEQMNKCIIDTYNNLVGPDDTVYFLGDVCMGIIKDNLQLIKKLNGEKHLIYGNHDRPSKTVSYAVETKRLEWHNLYLEQFESCSDTLTMQIEDDYRITHEVILSHLPYSTDNNYLNRPYLAASAPKDNGGWLICGHVHESWKVNGKQINVGVDAWGLAPVALKEIIKIMGQK